MYSGNLDPAMLSKLIPAFEGLEYMGEGIQKMYGGSAEDAAQCKKRF